MKVANRLRAALLALAAVPAMGTADPLFVPVAGGSGNALDNAVGRIVQSITEYTTWPRRENPVTLCVIGPASHANGLDGLRLADGRLIDRQTVTVATLTARVRGQGVLTIAEFDPDCRSQAMFCLLYPPQAVTFRMNIDAIARSGLKVDPRVLRISQGGR